MSATRTSLVVGPALCSFRGASFFSKEETFNINVSAETFDINTSAHGKVDERAIEAVAETSITPEGRYTQALLDALWLPFANMKVGTSLVGYTATTGGVITATNSATDEPLVMSAIEDKHTLLAAACTKPPDIILSATKTIIGAATFKGVRSYGTSWTDNNSIYTVAAGGATNLDDATFDPLDILTQPYTAYWAGSAGFGTSDAYADGFETQDGFTLSWDVTTKDIPTDTAGNFDIRLVKIAVMAKCVPIGPTAAQILTGLKIQNSARGHSLASVGGALTITAPDETVFATINNAALKTAGYRFGPTELRNNEIGFVATRTFTAGVQQPLFTLAAP